MALGISTTLPTYPPYAFEKIASRTGLSESLFSIRNDGLAGEGNLMPLWWIGFFVEDHFQLHNSS